MLTQPIKQFEAVAVAVQDPVELDSRSVDVSVDCVVAMAVAVGWLIGELSGGGPSVTGSVGQSPRDKPNGNLGL